MVEECVKHTRDDVLSSRSREKRKRSSNHPFPLTKASQKEEREKNQRRGSSLNAGRKKEANLNVASI
jgi:hypothetical protein